MALKSQNSLRISSQNYDGHYDKTNDMTKISYDKVIISTFCLIISSYLFFSI